MGLSSVRIGDPYRRDRLLLLNAIAIVLLTLLGGSRRSARHGSSAQEQHGQAPRAFLVSSGLPVLRRHPQHAGANFASLMERFQALMRKQSHCRRVPSFEKMRGYLRANPGQTRVTVGSICTPTGSPSSRRSRHRRRYRARRYRTGSSRLPRSSRRSQARTACRSPRLSNRPIAESGLGQLEKPNARSARNPRPQSCRRVDQGCRRLSDRHR